MLAELLDDHNDMKLSMLLPFIVIILSYTILTFQVVKEVNGIENAFKRVAG